MKLAVHVFWCIRAPISAGYLTGSENAESQGKHVHDLVDNYQLSKIFVSIYTPTSSE